MVLDNIIEVGLKGNRRIPYYKEKGYEIPMVIGKKGKPVVDYSKKLYVKLEDMPEYSESKVKIKCDYQEESCRNVYEKNVADYIKNNKNSVVKKDCCSNIKCQNKKMAECNLINYGFEYHLTQPNIIEQIKNTNVEKYGSENIFSSDYFKVKIKDILLEKYGVENVSKSEDIKIKKAETFYKNGTVATSKQQKYLHNLFGGDLNYANNTPSLDIAFPKEKIYIEYDGSGHSLSVKQKSMTEEEFKQREVRRYYYMKKLGWKVFKIISLVDYLPSDEILLEEFNKAKEWFKSDEKGHWHYNINIGNKVNDELYGKLRRIKEKDIKEVG